MELSLEHERGGASAGAEDGAARRERLLFPDPRAEFAEPHFFVVVNRDPLGKRLLLLAIVSSRLDKVRLRNRERPHTVVEVSPTEYDEFRVVSAVDCNVVLEKPLSELVELVRCKQVRYHKDLPTPVFEKIRTAVLASPVLAEELKRLL